MSARSDEVYDGRRCAVCEHRFEPSDRVAIMSGTAERVHYDAPEDCPPGEPS